MTPPALHLHKSQWNRSGVAWHMQVSTCSVRNRIFHCQLVASCSYPLLIRISLWRPVLHLALLPINASCCLCRTPSWLPPLPRLPQRWRYRKVSNHPHLDPLIFGSRARHEAAAATRVATLFLSDAGSWRSTTRPGAHLQCVLGVRSLGFVLTLIFLQPPAPVSTTTTIVRTCFG